MPCPRTLNLAKLHSQNIAWHKTQISALSLSTDRKQNP
jgi:hypothetical protein